MQGKQSQTQRAWDLKFGIEIRLAHLCKVHVTGKVGQEKGHKNKITASAKLMGGNGNSWSFLEIWWHVSRILGKKYISAKSVLQVQLARKKAHPTHKGSGAQSFGIEIFLTHLHKIPVTGAASKEKNTSKHKGL